MIRETRSRLVHFFSFTRFALRPRTYFDVLGVPLDAVCHPNNNSNDTNHQIDTKALQKTLHKLQRQYHPDSLVGKPQEEIELCEEKAAEVNSAYTVMKDDYNRNRYIAYCLALFKSAQGKEMLASLDRSQKLLEESEDVKLDSVGQNRNLVSVQFLEEIMDIHEELEDAEEEEEVLSKERRGEIQSFVDNLANECKGKCQKLLSEHGDKFWVNKMNTTNPEEENVEVEAQRQKFTEAVLKWTYAWRLQQKLSDLD